MSADNDQTTPTTEAQAEAQAETKPTKPANPDEYNGWRNFETWVVMLWIDNERGSYNYAHEIVANCFAHAAHQLRRSPTAITYPRLRAAETLKEWIETDNPLAHQANMFTDLLNGALSRVDWMEIADHIHDEE